MDGRGADRVGSRGGPKTATGKAASRRNAVRHGLSATTLLPEILGRELVDQFSQQFRAEWQPKTPTEEFFVREMARHRAALERIEQIEQAVLRRGARGALDLFVGDVFVGDETEWRDAALAGAGTSEAIERVTRYRRPHERAFAKGLAALRSMQEVRARQAPAAAETTTPVTPDGAPPADNRPRFPSEHECEAHLLGCLERGEVACPRCESRAGHWIASRQVWQCQNCRRQAGLRTGTVMAGSPLPLVAWFTAIETLLKNPDASTAELITATGIRRAATVRRMAGRIRQAMSSGPVSIELAGLESVLDAVATPRTPSGAAECPGRS